MKSNMNYHDPNHGFERGFWGDCSNTFGEEIKQWVYAHKMGLNWTDFYINASGKKILDIGGGPVSLLLKCNNLGTGSKVIDPIRYPNWVYGRYDAHGVLYEHADGERDIDGQYDEVWIYNVLQHCVDPAKIIANAKRAAPILRIFEWLDIPPHAGHPHMLVMADLDAWIGGKGKVEYLNEHQCLGTAYSGVFATR